MVVLRVGLAALFLGVASFCMLPLIAAAEVGVSKEAVSFATATVIESDKNVKGELRIPDGDRVPAVVIIHNLGGLHDRTGSAYVEALNQAGFATLELDLFPRGAPPGTTRGHVAHTYGSLIFLANNPRIDPNRIGVMGFSFGGILSMVTVSKELTDTYTGGNYRFAAHLPLYPACWAMTAVMEGKIKTYSSSLWQTSTGAPVHILAGESDDYGPPDMCPKFVQSLPEATRSHVTVTVYPDAKHGWDTFEDRSYFDNFAANGKGGYVRHHRNSEIAEKSKAFAIEFFKSSMGSMSSLR